MTKSMTMISSELLLRYFSIAQRRLQQLSTSDDLNDYTLVGASTQPLDSLLSRHRLRIVEAQLASLDEALSEWEHNGTGGDGGGVAVSHNSMREVLQQIGSGDYSGVSFPGVSNHYHKDVTTVPAASACGLRSRTAKVGNNSDYKPRPSTTGEVVEDNCDNEKTIQKLLNQAVEQTNELARRAFARSVLLVGWRNYQNSHNDKKHLPQSERELRDINDGKVDDAYILEYCGMMMAAVQLSEVQHFLRSGRTEFLRSTHLDSGSIEGFYGSSVDDRLLHIQRLYWRALGWDPDYAVDQLNRLVSFGCTSCTNADQHPGNAKVLEALETYASAMIEAVTNASMINMGSEEYPKRLNDDGTTRVVSVSYSEKFINLPHDTRDGVGGYHAGCAPHSSLSAPTSNTINEHSSSQQRSELNAAKATSALQQQIWDEFQLLDRAEQMETVEAAKIAHVEFLEMVANTPPGAERILLIQRMDDDMQKLLMIYKLWSSHTAAVGP